MDKHKRNKIICYSTVLILLIIFGVIIFSIFDAINNLNRNIIATVNKKDYSANEFVNEFKVDIKVNNKSVIVNNGETNFYCKFNVGCEVWPDSKGGAIMYEEPLFSVTFRRE